MTVGDLSRTELDQVRKLSRTGFETLFGSLEEAGDREGARAVVKARCRDDRLLFAKVFFGDKLDRPFSPFHLAALTAPKVPFRERPQMGGWRRARMGPRGNGKTTIYVRI